MSWACPACGSDQLRHRRTHGSWEQLVSFLGFGRIRCLGCDYSFRETLLWLPGLRYARCPKCFRNDLSDWAEKYFYPSAWSRMLLHFGAKGHRCPVCRHNFVSFLPRKRDFSPSWKQKEPPKTNGDSDMSDTVESEV